MAATSASLRLFSQKVLQSPTRKLHTSFSKALILIPNSLFYLFASPISFQRLSKSSPQPIVRPRSHPQQQQSASSSDPPADDAVVNLLPPALREIVALFQSVGDDPKAKYQQLLHYGSQLPPLDPRFKNDEHRVRGCVSQVWVRAFPDPADPAVVRFEADSDSSLTKGLAALLVFGLSGYPAPVISRVLPEFVLLLGLRQSLTPSRNNGFLNMLKIMQEKALQVHNTVEGDCSDDYDDYHDDRDLTINVNGWRPLDYAAAKNEDYSSSADAEARFVLKEKDASLARENDMDGHAKDEDDSALVDGDEAEAEAEADVPLILSSGTGGRGERIKELLQSSLSPVELDVEDISHLHSGHAGIAGSRSGETHFNVKVVSAGFEGKSLVKRHRLVYDLLHDELQSGLHALSIDAKTPSEVKQPS
ncbi:SufE-like protein, chloroplastic [Apostasia shenzhenica]|uniref:SufE-like protein, chloroplastic n=1 Tax=Apostasia shenzhenica TaxID=1088818 RepID=A0A2I0A747_9ASPA|nr:SufE-like protein, chloroplastic [Apostasia shenzhenica]